MHVLVLDGYNIIHAIPELVRRLDQSLEEARRALIERCRAYQSRSRTVAHTYVVFDGHEAAGGSRRQHEPGVTIVFTSQEDEADEEILRLLRRPRGTQRFTIVSNDTYVFNNARAHGARVMPAAEFWSLANPLQPRARPQPEASEKPLSAQDARRITEEYRRHLERGVRRPLRLSVETPQPGQQGSGP